MHNTYLTEKYLYSTFSKWFTENISVLYNNINRKNENEIELNLISLCSVLSLFSCRKFTDVHTFMLSMQTKMLLINLWVPSAFGIWQSIWNPYSWIENYWLSAQAN